MPGETEVLVVVDRAISAKIRERLAAQFPILHSLLPAVFVVSGDADAARRIARIPGVRVAADSSDDQEISELPDLSPAERLFVAAWLSNARGEPRARPGDGLKWDSLGRLPPDRPEPWAEPEP